MAADGGFEGDGVLRSSYNNIGNDRNRQLFNLVFHEVRTFAENGYQRVGAWFPLLGNNKRKLPYTENIITMAIHAAVWLHNFIMNTENLSYSALESPEMEYRQYY